MSELVLLTGAAGLIGRAVRPLLESRGDSVVAIDRIADPVDGIIGVDLTEVHRLHELSQSVDAIIHCGAISGPMVARDNPHLIVQSNIVGTANVLEIARIRKVRRLVFCSSVSAYGHTPTGIDPVPEDVVLAPISVYGASKVAGEQLVNAYAIQHGVDGVSLRPSWVYGPRRTTECAIRSMIEDARVGRKTSIPHALDLFRQYVHVDDVAAAIVAALDVRTLARRSYTITGGSYVKMSQVADIVRSLIPSADIVLGAGLDPTDDVQARFDIHAAARDLGYSPRVDLSAGIASYADWLASR